VVNAPPREVSTSHSDERDADPIWPVADAPPTAQDLAQALHRLRRRDARRRDDSPLTYRELSAKTGWSFSVIAEYFAGTVLAPTDRFDVLVRLLGATEPEQRVLATARDDVEDSARRRAATARRSTHDLPPRMLPADVAVFTGRATYLAQLDGLLSGDDQPPVVVIAAITGTPGVGKTTLAVHWAHHVSPRFPDGQLYINLRGHDPSGSPVGAADAVRVFLDALAVAPQRIPASLDGRTALFRSLLATRQMLIVLDNARDTAQVHPLLPGAPGCLVVVTSRNQLTGLLADGAHAVHLDLLPAAEARELLERRIGAARVAREPESVDEIIGRCARLPLALAIVAARAASNPEFPLATLAAELRRPGGEGLDALDGGDPATDIRAVFSWSYRTLSPDAAGLFRQLGLHPGPDIGDAAVASLAGLPVTRARPVLAELTRRHLIEEHAPGRYTLHDLLRTYATERAEAEIPEGDRAAATLRLLDHYLHTAYPADRLVNPERDPLTLVAHRPAVTPEPIADRGQAMAWFAAEHAVLLRAVDLAVRTGADRHVWQLASAMADFLTLRGHYSELTATQEAALAATGRSGDRHGQARIHRSLASAYFRVGRFDDAHTQLELALRLCTELGDRLGEAHSHLNIGSLLAAQGRHREALGHAELALALYTELGPRAWQARSVDAIGWLHARLGNQEQALAYCQRALDLHREIGDRHGEAEAWDSLGYAHHRLGDHDQATACYEQGVALYQEIGDRFNEATTLANLGDDRRAAGDPDGARAVWVRALAILDELRHADAEAVRTKLADLDGAATAS
jgi:tetratricopeptide (TPR) repeat protein